MSNNKLHPRLWWPIALCSTGLFIACTQKRPLPSFYEWRERHSMQVAALEQHLIEQDITHVLPLEQMLRAASDWSDCYDEPYAVPPPHQWDSLVAVLRLLGALRVAGIVGEVEVHSGFRNPRLNICAGGAARSAHTRSFALDFTPITSCSMFCREDLGGCAISGFCIRMPSGNYSRCGAAKN